MSEADPIMKFFEFRFTGDPVGDDAAMKIFHAAKVIDKLPRNAERSTALRKLLECMDATRRAVCK